MSTAKTKAPLSSRTIIPAPHAQSLAWRGDTLIDWVGGGTRRALDGSVQDPHRYYSYPFDAAIDCVPYAVVYERRGTKGLLLRDGGILRELNRSFYHARCYDYPIALWRSASGRCLLAHCPEDYNRLEIEDAETGRRLTESEAREPIDYFYSGLAASPSGHRLVSAGWVWHPWRLVVHTEIAPALEAPRRLDAFDDLHAGPDMDLGEQCSACWLSDARMIVATEEYSSSVDGSCSIQNGLAIYDVAEARLVRTVQTEHPAGLMMPAGEDRVLTFFGHPRLISMSTGEVEQEWPDLVTGATGSLGVGEPPVLPPLALDRAGRRFAVHRDEEIVVITLKPIPFIT